MAAEHAHYAGHRFRDLCEIDVRDGSRGYSRAYQAELFCHNNPGFLDMHEKYLRRLISEVPLDGIQVDDMCDYGGLTTCGCVYCRERFRKEYGRELPPFDDKTFWGDTSGHPLTWGNYENPVFRDWLRMKTDSVVDHVKMIKSVIGDIPLMTCCSSTGPNVLHAVSLNLERMKDHLDLVMLENCGLGIGTVNWDRMDAEALQQKDIADKMGRAPAIALSYTVYEKGAYLGWALSRFWGVGNWSSTLTGRLAYDPEDAKEIHELIGPINNWEREYSDLDHTEGRDVAEVRLVSNRFCKENGWRDENGVEHWDRVCAWSKALLRQNIGYRFVRAEELSDVEALCSENTPLILDGVGCVSDAQFAAVQGFLRRGGTVWLNLPFGTHDEYGYKHARPLSEELKAISGPGLVVICSESAESALKRLVSNGGLQPRIVQVSGDARWAARLRVHPKGVVMHLMNRALEAVPHPDLVDAIHKEPVLLDVRSLSSGGLLEYVIEFDGIGFPWRSPVLRSPEIGGRTHPVIMELLTPTRAKVAIDMMQVSIYGVVEEGQG
jgi:hypothetical protein